MTEPIAASELLNISYNLFEYSLLKLRESKANYCVGVFYDKEIQRKNFVNKQISLFGINSKFITDILVLGKVCCNPDVGMTFIIDMDEIDIGINYADQIISDRNIRNLCKDYRINRISVALLKRIRLPYVANQFQHCDLLLKL